MTRREGLRGQGERNLEEKARGAQKARREELRRQGEKG